MASNLSTEDVLAVLAVLDSDSEEETELDDPREVILEGSDEEFGAFEDQEDTESGTVTNSKTYLNYIIIVM